MNVNVSPDLTWQRYAACAHPDIRGVFHKVSNRSRSKTVQAAKQVCKTCIVRVECDFYARTHHVTDGVWAGKFYDLNDGYYGLREERREGIA